jgi:predicted ABC-class ATPase
MTPLLTQQDLFKKITALNGRGYKAYQDLTGSYAFENFMLFIDHVQGDPFATPSRIRVRIAQKSAAFPPSLYQTKTRQVALTDYLAREIARILTRFVKGNRGTGKSGLISIDRCGQEILERTAVLINPDWVEARLRLGLPARGRTILGRDAEAMLLEELPRVIENALFYHKLNTKALTEHVQLAEDQEYIRAQLTERGLVAFVANGATLPRRSGISDAPMPATQAIPFQTPSSLAVSLPTRHHGTITGMGIPAGITLIVGGGYHGKSTLLRALERGVYNHLPGDGREWVLTVTDAVKIRAENGRCITRVNISPFINNLPFNQDTDSFSTEEASGSTSQTANIIEALEIGTSLLLLDEDTSATNFMIRDERMQQLVAKINEPITPFIDKVRLLKEQYKVSTIMVVGGSGDYFDVADTVVMLQGYLPQDVTRQAQAIARQYVTRRRPEGGSDFGQITPRVVCPASFNATHHRKIKVETKSLAEIRYGNQTINLQYVEQLVSISQTRAIADAFYRGSLKYCDGNKSLKSIINLILQEIDEYGLDILSPYYGQHPGEYARPRKHEIAAAMNRLRSLQIS